MAAPTIVDHMNRTGHLQKVRHHRLIGLRVGLVTVLMASKSSPVGGDVKRRLRSSRRMPGRQ
jgi:hypothetical protein